MDRAVIERRAKTPALGRRGFVAALLAATSSAALGRIPYGGTLRLKVPWPIAGIDPHALDDATAALFGPGDRRAALRTGWLRTALPDTGERNAGGHAARDAR